MAVVNTGPLPGSPWYRGPDQNQAPTAEVPRPAPTTPAPAPNPGGLTYTPTPGSWFTTQPPPATTPGPTAVTTAGGGGGGDPYAIIQQAQAHLPPTEQSIDQVLAALRAQGIQAVRATHANGTLPSDDVIILPNGDEIDLVNDVGGPGASWRRATGPTGRYDPSRTVVGPTGEFIEFGQFLQQQGLPGYSYQGGGEGGGGGFDGGGGGGGGFADWGTGYAPFAGPYGELAGTTASLAGIQAAAREPSPGFEFRLAEGQKALERSAAARGTLLTGGTAKAIDRYAQDYASQEYANQYARLFGEQGARYGQLAGTAGLGLAAQGQRAGQLYNLSALGLNAAGQAANLGSAYAANQGNLYNQQATAGTDLITGGANAGAAGRVGAANANAGGLTGVSNSLLQLILLSQLGRTGTPAPS